jgi:DNA ligase (NAD+)
MIYLEIPKNCPFCNSPTIIKYSESGIKTLHCTNPDCSCRLINKLDHFASRKAMDIKGLSKATLEKLINWGWIDSIYDIYRLNEHSSEWKRKPGFGAASVNKILEAIENSKNCTLDKFITAIDIPLIGSTIAKDLMKHFHTWQEFRNAVKEDYSFWKLPGFGLEMDAAITSFDFTEADRLTELMNFNSEETVEVESTLAGMNICITGKLKEFKNRDSFIAAVEAHGGKVTGSVSRKTAILVNNDSESESSKNKTAKSYNIPILTEQEFIEKYLK